MNPEEREAYLEILKGADVQKIDRGEWKSVRVVLSITPKFLDVARAASARRLAEPANRIRATVQQRPAAKPQPASRNQDRKKD